ncbi:MAG: ATP-binding protein [Kiritimatiellae bacterium]|nr:ATP-binding protein [Kiritimatiellia bacterium]
MSIITVQAQRDHIASLCTGSPIQALSELIWNALDADALNVKVDLVQNPLGGIDTILVSDDGIGIDLANDGHCFANLGGSWKRTVYRTRYSDRVIHGRKGKGRFKAFSLGNHVEWRTTVQTDSGLHSFTLDGRADDPGHFELTEFPQPGPATGTEVRIGEIIREPSMLLDNEWAVQQLASQFALYLRAYPNVKIWFRGLPVNPLIVQRSENIFQICDANGQNVAELRVIEWKNKQGRSKIVFCNHDGFALHEVDAAVRPGSGFNYTAYLISPRFKQMHQENLLVLEELNPEIKTLLETAREMLREHFKERKAMAAADQVNSWKEQQVYPYRGEPADDAAAVRRRRFDACALAVRAVSENFDQLGAMEKSLIFGLLKELVETDPDAAVKKLGDILGLPLKIK